MEPIDIRSAFVRLICILFNALRIIRVTSLLQICLVTLFCSSVYAQEQCATAARMVPQNLIGEADLQRVRANISKASFAKQQGDTLFFPTVVHVIHNGGVGNISDSQIVDGLRIINEDFNRENPDTSMTRDLFKPYAAAVGFKFILAKLDSNGDSTSGIVRIDTSIIPHPEPTSPDFDNCKFLSHWPPDMYYNIWIVPSIQGNTLGYAQYPGTNFTYGGPWETWGIVVRHDQWGTIGTSSADGRTGTHEVGHTFGLYHPFLSFSAGCGGICDTTGDEVCDTPPVTNSGGCATVANTCVNDTAGSSVYTTNVLDQIENFMSYNTCQNMLTEGQKDRMRGFIASFPILQGLYSDSNLFASGVIDAMPVGLEPEREPATTMTVLPNPFVNEVNVNLYSKDEIGKDDIRIVNVLGQEVDFSVVASAMENGKQELSLTVDPNLNRGVYFLILRAELDILVRKLIKQ